MRSFKASCADPQIRVISVDVFDTLLLRTTKPEFDRFFEISERQSGVIEQHGHDRPAAQELYLLRRESARIAYRTRVQTKGGREAHWREIFELMLTSLGIPTDPALLSECLQEEIRYETECLSWNRELGDVLENSSRTGKTVVCLSDMYLPSDAIKQLIDTIGNTDLGLRVFSSADYGFGKGGGQIFSTLASATNVALSEIVHLGDNYHTDYLAPLSVGVRAHHLPRPVMWRTIQKSRSIMSHLKYPAL